MKAFAYWCDSLGELRTMQVPVDVEEQLMLKGSSYSVISNEAVKLIYITKL